MNAILCAVLLCALPALVRNEISIPVRKEVFKNKQTDYGSEDISHTNVGEICIGTPEQCFSVLLDTGSTDFWISSSKCKGNNCNKLWNAYNSELSSTFEEREDHLNSTIRYGTNIFHTLVYAKDTVQFANIVVEEQDFAESLDVEPGLAAQHVDGILGLAMIELAKKGTVPLIYHLHEEKLISKKLFTMCTPSGEKAVGKLVIDGTADDQHTKSDIVYTGFDGNDYYFVGFSSIGVEGGDKVCTNCDVVVDSGTSHINGQRPAVDNLNIALGGTLKDKKKSIYTVDCNKIDSLPNVEFKIEGKLFTMTPKQYIKRNYDECTTRFRYNPVSSIDGWKVGQAFLNGLCTVYDIEKARVGFAKMDGDVYDV